MIEQLRFHGYINDDEYKLLRLAQTIKDCKLWGDTIPGKEGYTIKFEITLNKSVK